MKNYKGFIIKTAKGVLIGAGAITPGLSGGTMAIVCGVFEEILEATANFFSHIRKSITCLTPIVIGAIGGVFSLTSILTYFSLKYPLLSNYFFCIISLASALIFLNKRVEYKYSLKKALSLLCGTVTSAIISLLLETLDALSFDFGTISLIILGIPLAFALVLPGISFSYMLLFLGLYEKMLLAFAKMDFLFMFSLAFGIMIGIIIFSKLLLKLIENHPQETYSFVFGFVLCSIADILV